MKICVFGAASAEIDEMFIKTVESLGEYLAKRGHSLVFGAGGNGLMGAAARGFTKGNGKIFGVIPSFFKNENIEAIYDKCDELIFTETMSQRKTKMEDLADAFLVVPGGIGTFEELFEVFTLKQLGRHNKPIAIFNIDGYYEKMMDFLDVTIKRRFLKEECRSLYCFSSSVEKIVEYLENEEHFERNVHDFKLG